MQAIDTLESEKSSDRVFQPQPYETPSPRPVPSPFTPISPIEPVTQAPVDPAPLSTPEPVQEPVFEAPQSALFTPQPVAVELQNEPVPQPPVMPLDISQDNSNPIAPAPFVDASTNAKAKRPGVSKKFIIILVVAILVIGAATAAYFLYQSTAEGDDSNNTSTADTQTTAPTAKPTVTDTAAGVNETAGAIEKDIDTVLDTEYADSALSDTTLYDN